MTTIDRRRFLSKAGVASAAAGAMWVTPTVMSGSAAFAATSPGTCPQNSALAFVPGKATTTSPGWPTGDGYGIDGTPSNNNGWVFTQANMTGADALGVFSGYHPGPVPQFVVERNPNTSNIAGALVTYTHTLGPLSTATVYTISNQVYSVNSNQYTQLLDVQILDASNNVVTTLGRYRTDPSATSGVNTNYTLLSANTWGSYSWNFTPSVAATYQIRYRFTFTAAGTGANTGSNNGVGDDIAINAPTVDCM